MDIERIKWAASGRADADRLGYRYDDVLDVAESHGSVTVYVGDLRVMWLGGTPGRVMVVTADRESRTIAGYWITEVRPATPGEARAWEKRQR